MPISAIEALIEKHFPWGQDGCPQEPAVGKREAVERWLDDQTRESGFAALALIARTLPVVRELEATIIQQEGKRLFFRIDASSLRKTAAGILDKMTRGWDPATGQNPPYDFRALRMEDLARFRIVTNFLSDADVIVESIQSAYGSPAGQTSTQRVLCGDFSFDQNQFKDLTNLDPAKRKKGERCHKGVFRPRARQHICVEIQVQTLLQEAWDKKDHYLIYEPRRQGEPVRSEHEREIFAMSELLYVADLTFDRLREVVMANRRNRAGDNHAST